MPIFVIKGSQSTAADDSEMFKTLPENCGEGQAVGLGGKGTTGIFQNGLNSPFGTGFKAGNSSSDSNFDSKLGGVPMERTMLVIIL